MRSPKIMILLEGKLLRTREWQRYAFFKKDKISLNSSDRVYKFKYKMDLLKTCSYRDEPKQNCAWNDTVVYLF